MTDIKSEITKGESASQDMATCLDKLARSFEASARRWELVVYPSLLAFITMHDATGPMKMMGGVFTF
jgi:hypothetical protein